MKVIAALAACHLLLACGLQVDRSRHADRTPLFDPVEFNVAPIEPAIRVAVAHVARRQPPDEVALRRLVPLSNYARFPAAVRPMMQQADIDAIACDNPYPPEGYRACNRAHRRLLELERLGWCYGGAVIVSDLHWLRCRDDKTFRPGSLEAGGEPFSALEVAFVDDQASREQGGAGAPQLPALLRQRWREAARALATPVTTADRRRFPEAGYTRFPRQIRSILRRFDIEHHHCNVDRAGLDGASHLRACNRVYYATVELERLGWCRTREARGWGRCSERAGYVLGQAATDGRPYAESFIRRLELHERQSAS